jgi:hypothetical protein
MFLICISNKNLARIVVYLYCHSEVPAKIHVNYLISGSV